MKLVGKIHSVSDYIDQLLPLIQKERHIRHYFRGLSSDHSLLPILSRPGVFDNLVARYPESKSINDLEKSLLKRFRRYSIHHYLAGEHRPFPGGNPSWLEWLCVAQHHRLPTLLIDWSLKPLVALYFAVLSQSPKPGIV